MTDRKPQKGDRVRVTFEGVYVRSADGDHHIVTADQDWSLETPNGAVVEVLEPADDPSKDLAGTLRREDCEGTEFNLWQRVLNPLRWLCTHSTSTGMVGTSLPSSEIGSWPVVGSVPGTPAAEADGSDFLRELTQGQRRIGENDKDYADRLVKAGLAHRVEGSDTIHFGSVVDCKQEWCITGTPVDPHKPVVLLRAETTQPRVFTADGPVPPVDVHQVRDRDGALLSRVSDDDLWIGEGGWREGRETYFDSVKPWNEHVLAKYDPYTEVRS